MKVLRKNSFAVLIALLYCLAMGGTPRGLSEPPLFPTDSKRGTEKLVSDTPDTLQGHIQQPAYAKLVVKHDGTPGYKLHCFTLTETISINALLVAQPYSQYIKKVQNARFFTCTDIIFPFHSFW